MSDTSLDARRGVSALAFRLGARWAQGQRMDVPLPREVALGITRATAVGLVASIATALGSVDDYDAYRTWPMVVAFAVMVPCTVLCVAGTLLRPSDFGPIRILAAVTLVVLVLYGLAGAPRWPTLPYSPLHILVMPGMMLMPVAFGVRTAVASALLLGVVTARARIAGVGVYQGTCESVYFAACVLAFAVLYGVVTQLVATINHAEEVANRATATQAATRAALRARAQFDDMIHNVVLGALLQATMATDAPARAVARELAGQAHQALNRPRDGMRGAPPNCWRAAVADQAAALGLQVDIQQRGQPADGTQAAALLDATVAALTNVRRHAGTSEASVHARFDAGAQVTIRDDGVGFDPARVDVGRYGLRVAIGDRLRTVGGTAQVRSAPGNGTQITLTIPPAAASIASPAPDLHTLRHPVLLLALSLIQAGYLAIGWLYLDTARLPVLNVVFAFGMLTMTALLWLMPPTGYWRAAASVVFLLPVAFAINTQDLGVPDWRTWYVGFADVAAATIAARFSPRFALIATLGSAAGYAVTQLVADPPLNLVIVLNAWPQVLIFAVVGASIRWGMGRFQARLAAANSQIQRLDEQRRVDQARADIIAERSADLQATVVPMLRRIADGPALTDDERAAAARTELALRDQLRNPLLLGTVAPALKVQIEIARRRGTRVELQTEPLHDLVILALVARVLLDSLPTLGATATIRAVATGPDAASVSVTGGPLASVAAPDGLVTRAMTDDDFSMLSITRAGASDPT